MECSETPKAAWMASDPSVSIITWTGCLLMMAHQVTNNLSMVKTNVPDYRQKTCRAKMLSMTTDARPFSDIAERIRWHRSLEGLTQDEYAQKAGLKRAQLNNWETGKLRLSLDGALALRRTYGLSLDFMYEGIADALPMTLRVAWRDRPAVSASK
ncbi:XRE family transcriptional regulator [Pseudooceanicola sediminis]|uniref:XRE family transcriptional regulator n=2 Tax=Pseudooceanicola sediminis TaxID=2211117 RepID=A0A399J0P2_9RHOB|nr:XRE family transcriptional regulator [Pseudooceanicola sediminis]